MEKNNPPSNHEIQEEPNGHQQQLLPGLESLPEEHTALNMKHIEQVSLSIKDKLRKLPSSHSCHCIHRVPDSVREVKPHCYTPRLVSIGPLHHKNTRLNSNIDLKLRFFKSFLERIPITEDKELQSIHLVAQMEPQIRRHYQDEIKLDTKDFCEMILLDAVFIVELLLKKQENDPMFENHWWFCDLLNDILLIENQIPFLIPRKIYEKFYKSDNNNFFDLVDFFFKNIDSVDVSSTSGSLIKEEPMHFIQYLRMPYIHSTPSNSGEVKSKEKLIPKKKKKWKSDVLTASILVEYGVKFEKATTTPPFDIQFQEGILTIPKIKVNEWTENLFRNLVAFEQCNLVTPKYVSDYLIFMDSLIDTPEDVKILIDAGIIQDDLQDTVKLSEMFNNIHKEVILERRYYLFAEQSRELNEYRRNLRHQWKARWYRWNLILKRDYFNSPWSTIAFFIGLILLGLTIVQTICSIYQVMDIKWKVKK